MPATVATYANFRIDPSFDFNNFSQEHLILDFPAPINTRPDALRPTLTEDGTLSYRLSSQSRTSSSCASSGGPLTPRQQTISQAFSTAPSIASTDLEPHALMDDNASIHSTQSKARTQSVHPRFSRMSVWGGRLEETATPATPHIIEDRPSDMNWNNHNTSRLSTQTSSAEEEEDVEEEIIESPQIYHVLELENDLIEDMVSVKLAKPLKPHKAETVVFTRPKTLTIPSTPEAKKTVVKPTTSTPNLRPPLNKAITAQTLPVLGPKPPPKLCPIHGNKHKSAFITASLPSTPVTGHYPPLPSPALPSKLRHSMAVDSMRKSVAISIKSFDEARMSRQFANSPKPRSRPQPEQAAIQANRKSLGRRKFSFEEESAEPQPSLPLPVKAPEAVRASEIADSKPEKASETRESKIAKAEEVVQPVVFLPVKAPVTSVPASAVDENTDSYRTSLDSFQLDLTLTLPSDGNAPSVKASESANGTDDRPISSWTTRPSAIQNTLPARTSWIPAPLNVITYDNGQSHNNLQVQGLTPTSPVPMSTSLQFLQEDPFNSRPSIDPNRPRPKSSGGECAYNDFDPVLSTARHSTAPSVKSSKSTRSLKGGLSKLKRMLSRKKTRDI